MSEKPQKHAPPYASFSSLINFLNKLKDTAVPSRIDPSVFGNASGAISYSVIAALKFLALIDDAGTPRAKFRELVQAEEAERKSLFAGILRASYPSLFDGDLDLATVSSGQFDEHLRDRYEIKGSTVDKVATFFIAAAAFSEIPISPHLKVRKATSPSGASRQSTKRRRSDTAAPEGSAASPIPSVQEFQKPLEYQLIDLMSETDIDDQVKQSIWSLVQYLSLRKARRGG